MILIVGAGPAGLAVANELRRRGCTYRVLERDSVGTSWLHHYDRLHVHTLKQISGLPGLPMPPSYPRFPSGRQFQAYLAWYAGRQHLVIETGVEVQRADYDGSMWHLTTNRGPFAGETLVVASGIWSTPYRPSFPGEADFQGSIIHARDYRNPTPFTGQRVLVVGAGNSGSEIAVDLSEHGVETGVTIRGGVAFVPRATSPTAMRLAAWLLRTLPRTVAGRLLRRRDFSGIGLPRPPGSPLDTFPVVGYDLPHAVAAGRVAVYRDIERFTAHGVRFADGREFACDSVILATGYRPTIQFVAHELKLDSRGWPRLDRHWRAAGHRHLYCVGFWYPNTEGWLQSIGRVARITARSIAREHGCVGTSSPPHSAVACGLLSHRAAMLGACIAVAVGGLVVRWWISQHEGD